MADDDFLEVRRQQVEAALGQFLRDLHTGSRGSDASSYGGNRIGIAAKRDSVANSLLVGVTLQPAGDALGHTAVAEDCEVVVGTYVFYSAVEVVAEFPREAATTNMRVIRFILSLQFSLSLHQYIPFSL